jgi:molybdopterin-guanine dinucleotide biosynthesis protein A
VTRPDAIAAIVLAGGRAMRLGGGDKPLRTLGGRPMLQHILERLRPPVDTIALSANGDPGRFAEYRLPVLADAGRQSGPLSGILSGMRWADSAGYGLAMRLGSAIAGRPNHVAVASSGGHVHPVFALWPVPLASELERFLAESASYSVAAFLERHETVCVDFAAASVGGKTIDPFFNVNTPQDLAEADAIVRGQKP